MPYKFGRLSISGIGEGEQLDKEKKRPRRMMKRNKRRILQRRRRYNKREVGTLPEDVGIEREIPIALGLQDDHLTMSNVSDQSLEELVPMELPSTNEEQRSGQGFWDIQ